MKKKIFLILTIIWMGFIFYLSNQPSSISANQSGGFMKMLSNLPVVGVVLSNIMTLSIAEFLVRKSAHMFLYFVLVILIYMTISKSNEIKSYIVSFSLTVLYACTDEFHQLFIDGRSAEIRDVLVDSTGALIGIVLLIVINGLINKKVRRHD